MMLINAQFAYAVCIRALRYNITSNHISVIQILHYLYA